MLVDVRSPSPTLANPNKPVAASGTIEQSAQQTVMLRITLVVYFPSVLIHECRLDLGAAIVAVTK